MGVDLTLKNIPEDIAKRILSDKRAEVVLRDGKKRYDLMRKYAVAMTKETKPQINPEIFSKLNVALTAVNIAATIACTVIICNKLNTMNKQLNEIQKELEEIKDTQLKTTVLPANAKLVEDYKLNGRKMEKGGQIPKEEMLEFIRDCNRNINTLLSVEDNVKMDAILGEIFVLLPMMCNYILLYYRTYYTSDEGTNALHEDWIHTLDALMSDEFMERIQDYLFIEKGYTNQDVNEYLSCQRHVVSEFKQRIEQLVDDLNICEGVEGYEEAMLWSRQYAEQQAKSYGTELEKEYGPEKTEEIMNQAMQAINAW